MQKLIEENLEYVESHLDDYCNDVLEVFQLEGYSEEQMIRLLEATNKICNMCLEKIKSKKTES